MKTKLETYNNDWYKRTIGASRFKCVLWYYTNIFFFINPLNPFSNLKIFLLRTFGARINKGVLLKPSINIKYPWKLTIGENSWIGENVWIDNLDSVVIGANVCISQGGMILTGNHDYSSEKFDLKVSPIVLEDGVWIGAKAIVCPGVTCKSHAVLTAGSVATGLLDEYTIYKGNPAVPIKKRVIRAAN